MSSLHEASMREIVGTCISTEPIREQKEMVQDVHDAELAPAEP